MATLKNTTIDGTGALGIPRGNSSQRPSSPSPRQIRFNTETGTVEQYRNGVNDWLPVSNTGVIATGGDAVYDVNTEGTTYRVHVFTATGTSTFSVLQGGEIEFLLIGGGGDGANGNSPGGGGGAGGLVTAVESIDKENYDIVVGNSTEDSSFKGYTGLAGGNGSSAGRNGNDGGSGGGAGQSDYTGGNALQPQETPGIGFGNAGGISNGGGGGAGQPGQGNNAGNGLVSFITGTAQFYAGGGGGMQGGQGGLGGGGTGGSGNYNTDHDESSSATPSTPSTGAGGPANHTEHPNQAVREGGSGIVVIRYPLRQNNPETAAEQDVRNGLVLDLDFAKPTVYSGSGSVVSDSRLNGMEGSINGSPISKYTRTHRSAIETPANQTTTWIRLPEKALQSLPNGTVWTLEWAMTILSHSGTRYCHSMASSSTANNLVWQINSGSMKLFQGTLQSGADPSYSIGTPILLTLTRNNSTFRIYKNGAFAAEYSASRGSQNDVEGWVQDQEQDSILGRFDSNQNTHADWFFNRLYSRVLLDSEIEQNFNFFRWRFGV